MDWLVRSTSVDDLKVGNLGGKVWSKIKHSNEVPEFSRMAEARVWKEAGFNSLRTHLKSKAQEAKAELRTRLETEKGSVMQAAVRLGPEGQEKILGCGKLGGLLAGKKNRRHLGRRPNDGGRSGNPY